jgi:hypothetical protein
LNQDSEYAAYTLSHIRAIFQYDGNKTGKAYEQYDG